MMELYYHIGRLFDYDGKSIYKLQHDISNQQFDENNIEEEQEYEYTANYEQTHFSSTKPGNSGGYQALRQKQNRGG
jgi:hypothetical protein